MERAWFNGIDDMKALSELLITDHPASVLTPVAGQHAPIRFGAAALWITIITSWDHDT
ncbi:MAG: hypothetical protein CM15mP60_1330 [Alphaproteobacteria bacterium]|nr:MAG: hypothetical protein CM15mP60_1330 [Alphaproteobacteria bacterium]